MKIDIDKAFENLDFIKKYNYPLDKNPSGNYQWNETNDIHGGFKAAFDLLMPIIEKLEKSNEFYAKYTIWDNNGVSKSLFNIINEKDNETVKNGNAQKHLNVIGGKLARQTKKEVNEMIERINNAT